MKLIILLLATVAISHAGFTEDEEQKWLEFKMKHGRMFLSPGKELKRKKTFLKNANDVEEHNKAYANGEVSYDKQLHMYSDMTEAEFFEKFTGVNEPEEAHDDKHNDAHDDEGAESRQSYPATLDLRTTAGVGPIRNQGGCGSCWAFSTCAAIEYSYWLKYGVAMEASEQELVDCVYGSYGGCLGGWMPTAMKYVSLNGGLAWNSQYPYVAKNGTCREQTISPRAIQLNSTNPNGRVKNDDAAIKSALATYGVLSVCVDCTDWGHYKSGVFVSPVMDNPQCLHAVAIVGYGVNATTNTPYWILRNQWGAKWGDNGYINVDARRDANNNTYGGIRLGGVYYPNMV